MLIIDNPSEFYARVGVLWLEDYEGMPIRPLATSFFREPELPCLLEFVRANPKFHVVSAFRKSGIMVNRFDASADGWLLGDDDADPDIVEVTTERYWHNLGDRLRLSFNARSSAKSS